jgi:hypothetical protein
LKDRPGGLLDRLQQEQRERLERATVVYEVDGDGNAWLVRRLDEPRKELHRFGRGFLRR